MQIKKIFQELGLVGCSLSLVALQSGGLKFGNNFVIQTTLAHLQEITSFI